ncbi:EAL domain-containing protein [Hahella ganghwensis]|uniref:EAL domain-containing protein n=1 Tax=Hahella ganghwensis TaxID=286420 RepID=UPI0003766A3D|nr:EAL domain-containing protein [Hahella ganghwensis]
MTYQGLKAFFILAILLVACRSGASTPISIDHVWKPVSVGPHLEYLEDSTNFLNIFDLIDNEDLRWQKNTSDTPNMGYTTSTYWFRFNIDNTSNQTVDRLIEIGYPLLDYVEMFQVSGGTIVQHYNTGDRHPFSSRAIEHRHFLFPISLNSYGHNTIYLRVKSESSLQVPIHIAEEVEFYTNDQTDLMRNSVYYGMMLVMILFNLFLFLSLRERVYLYYICFVFSFAAVQLCLHGIPSQYLWPDSPYLQDLGVLIFVPCIVLFTTFFTKNFLHLSENAPKMNVFFTVAGWVSGANLVCALFLNYETSIKLSLATVVPVSTACLLVGPYLWARGHTIARFYSLAWFSITLAAMVLAFNKMGWVPRTFLTENGLQFGSALEAVLLSMALADRLNSEREERFKAQESMLIESRQRQLAEEKLIYAALHNPITGTPNRTHFENWFDKSCRHKKLNKPLFLGMVHLLRFHEVNKTLGHFQADELLKQLTRKLNEWALEIPGSLMLDNSESHKFHIVAVEGVTFVILIDPEKNKDPEAAFAQLTARIAEPIEFKGLMIDIGGVGGTVRFPNDAHDGSTLIRNAQIAIDMGSRSGNMVTRYSENLNPYNQRRLTLAGELRKAILTDSLSLHFQPKISARENVVTGMEALLRWEHPEHGFIGPDEFIPIAEQTGIIHPLTHWVIDHAVGKVAALAQKGHDIAVAVNISAINLKEKEFAESVRLILKNHKVAPSRLSLEVTETAMMDDPRRALAVLKRLNLLGIRLSIDDFGTGYSSLAYIKQLPVQEIKIDRSFIMDMESNNGDAIIVQTMINMCHDLGFEVVAEGVETNTSCISLREMGCDYLQGFYLSRPLPFDKYVVWLSSYTKDPSSILKAN